MQNDQGCFGIPSRNLPVRSEIWVNTPGGYGSTNTGIRYYTNIQSSVGFSVTYIASSVLGDSFRINREGVYGLYVGGEANGSLEINMYISVNSSATTGSPSATETLLVTDSPANVLSSGSVVKLLRAGDIVRVHSGTNKSSQTGVASACFRITQVA